MKRKQQWENLKRRGLKRIPVYLRFDEYERIRSRARQEGKPLSGLLREAARHYTETPAEELEKEKMQKAWKKFWEGVGKWSRGHPDDASVRHDEYVGEALEEEWKRWQKFKGSGLWRRL